MTTFINRRLSLCAGAAALAVIAGCGRKAPEAEAKPEAAGNMAGMAMPGTTMDVGLSADQVARGGVKWTTVVAGSAIDTVELPGELMVDEDQTNRLSAPERGRVLTLSANVGDAVKSGQVLATLQSETATAARIDRTKAVAERDSRQAALDFAKAARERAERLLVLKSVSLQDVERARAEQTAATSALAQARADIERADADLARLGVDPATGHIRISSSIDGVVLSRDGVPAAVVEAGATILVVTNPESLWLHVAVPESMVAGIRPGAKLQFVVPALGGGSFDARVRSLAPSVDAASRTVPVRADVTNRGRMLRPNMLATVTLDRGGAHTGVAVPESAIQMLNGKPVVFMVTPDDKGAAKFMKHEVRVEAKTRDGMQIVTGVPAGSLIVTEGAFAVKAQFEAGKLKMEMGG